LRFIFKPSYPQAVTNPTITGNAQTEKLQLNKDIKCLTDMRQVNKYLFLLLLAITFSCEPVNYIDKIVAVDIYESSIPKNGTLNQDIDLELKARATNGCYSDLKIKLIETKDRHKF
jgi:hypothetical protein